MTTLSVQSGSVIRFNPDDFYEVTAYRNNAFDIVFEGDVSVLTISNAAVSESIFPTVTFGATVQGGYEGFSLPGLPFFYSQTVPLVLGKVQWDDGLNNEATVLGYVDLEHNYYYLSVVDGDPLPTNFADMALVLSQITGVDTGAGAFEEGQDLLTSGILGNGWSLSEDDEITGAVDGATYAMGSGNDLFYLTGQTVTFDGGDDLDRISLLESRTAGVVKLFKGVAYSDDGKVFLVDVENAEGSDFDDILRGDDGVNELEGLDGADRLFGRAGDDFLDGGDGDDYMEGGDDDDTFVDMDGNNSVRGGSGDDHSTTGSGDDVARMGSGADTVEAGEGNDRLFGNGDDDVLNGEGGDDLLEGGRGEDILFGGPGDDVLRGDNNSDRLDGGQGDDSLVGGSGADIFVFTDITGAGRDRVRDFQDGIDLIDITDYALDAAYVDATLEQSGSNVRLSLGDDANGNARMVILQDQLLADISSADFITFDI